MTAKTRQDILAEATEALSKRVATLIDAIEINNYKIAKFQSELNQKPDDSELHFVYEQTTRERRRHLRYAAATALICSVVSGWVGYHFATAVTNEQVKQRIISTHASCEDANRRIDAAVDYYQGVINEEESNPFINASLRNKRVARNQHYIDTLLANKSDCDKLFPLEK